MTVKVGGQAIRTTDEHPFYVQDQGWTKASLLSPGDLLRSHDGRWLPLECIESHGEVATVYNLRIAEYHTYFVGTPAWGFSVWSHNADYAPGSGAASEGAAASKVPSSAPWMQRANWERIAEFKFSSWARLGANHRKMAAAIIDRFQQLYVAGTGKALHQIRNVRNLGQGLFEIKHAGGVRVYLDRLGNVIGYGNKSTQSTDISRLLNLLNGG